MHALLNKTSLVLLVKSKRAQEFGVLTVGADVFFPGVQRHLAYHYVLNLTF